MKKNSAVGISILAGFGLCAVAANGASVFSARQTSAKPQFNTVGVNGPKTSAQGLTAVSVSSAQPQSAPDVPFNPDMNEDGRINIGDFVVFHKLVIEGDHRANCDRSVVPPVVNVADFTCFIQRMNEMTAQTNPDAEVAPPTSDTTPGTPPSDIQPPSQDAAVNDTPTASSVRGSLGG